MSGTRIRPIFGTGRDETRAVALDDLTGTEIWTSSRQESGNPMAGTVNLIGLNDNRGTRPWQTPESSAHRSLQQDVERAVAQQPVLC